jgi:hypothetical protein
LANDQDAWNRLSSEPIDPDAKNIDGTTQLAIDKLKSKLTVQLLRDAMHKIENKTHVALSKFVTHNETSKKALAESAEKLNLAMCDIHTSKYDAERRAEGYNKALEYFVKGYNNNIEREKELREMAEAVGTVDLRKKVAKFKAVYDNQHNDYAQKRDQEIDELKMKHGEDAAAAMKNGEVMGTFSVVIKMVSHSTNEPPRILEDGTRNPDHVATIGYEMGHRLFAFQELCALVAKPKDMAEEADYGFFRAMVEGMKAAKAAGNQIGICFCLPWFFFYFQSFCPGPPSSVAKLCALALMGLK